MKIVADKNIPFVQACFAHLGDVEILEAADINASAAADAAILLGRSYTRVNETLLGGSKVEFVATATIGVDHIDQVYLADRGIGFASAPGCNANSVAEYVVASLLTVAQRHQIDLGGASIGVIGVGNVGSRVAVKCHGMGMKVVLHDPPQARESGDPRFEPMEAVFGCDFVTLHTPLTREGRDATYHLADQAFFRSLKPGAVFMNSGRGPVHDTGALWHALEAGALKSICLDVWEGEPAIDWALLERVDIGTSHIAGYSYDGKVGGLMGVYHAVCDHLGVEPQHGAEDFLPKPDLPSVDARPFAGTDQEILHQTVQQVYSVDRDDQELRRVLARPAADRPALFDDLRTNYPRRREFRNTEVTVDDRHSSLALKLSGIGFRIAR